MQLLTGTRRWCRLQAPGARNSHPAFSGLAAGQWHRAIVGVIGSRSRLSLRTAQHDRSWL